MRLLRSLAQIRKEYRLSGLNESDMEQDPLVQLERWLNEAIDSGCHEPTAMTLSTCNTQGQPSARIVLLKEVSNSGCIFYTNYDSRKGRELAMNPRGALVFFWPQIERQVRVEGHAGRVEERESDSYFGSRPRGSMLGAWVSPQSQIIPNRKYLEDRWLDCNQKYSGSNIPRPSHWGGYCLTPNLMEFWQGRQNRLHDRIQYVYGDKGWAMSRLAP